MEMKLVAIYNVWYDSVELLTHSIKNLQDCGVDGVIVVWSERSNYGEVQKDYLVKQEGVHYVQCEPEGYRGHGTGNEEYKRNVGLNKAKELGFTHFLSLDSDEFYEPEEFKKYREIFLSSDINGIVCSCKTYFKKPSLTIGEDATLVPFIHKITLQIQHQFNRNYPYAWIDGKIRIDPTRSLNINSGVQFLPNLKMHHMSWIRKDIELKIRNSSAKGHIQRSTIRQDYMLAEEGYFVKYYGKHLATAPNIFNIPNYGELLDENIQSVSTANTAK